MWQHFLLKLLSTLPPSAVFDYFQTHELKQFVWPAQSAVVFDAGFPVLWLLASNLCPGRRACWELKNKLRITSIEEILKLNKPLGQGRKVWCSNLSWCQVFILGGVFKECWNDPPLFYEVTQLNTFADGFISCGKKKKGPLQPSAKKLKNRKKTSGNPSPPTALFTHPACTNMQMVAVMD